MLPNSVLVSINGMYVCLLCEPSKQALERLRQYEGHLELEHSAAFRGVVAMRVPICRYQTKFRPVHIGEPIHMTLVHQGQLYSALLVSNPPYGIDWSPCGNFALVKRVYAHGEQAGFQ
jgi:hypothetical protein